MQLFKSILDLEQETGRPADKRRTARYAVGDGFPFKVKLTLFPKGGASDAKGKDWSATPVEFSATGASVQLSMAAVAYQRETCRLKFALRDYQLEIPATINHFRCAAQYSLCGITFNLSNPELKKAYQQILEPIIIGNSLPPANAVQDVPGRHKDKFGGGAAAELTVLRTAPGGQITGFDLRMHQYMVRWAEGSPELELFTLNVGSSAASAGRAPRADLQYDEIRRLFSFTIPNLAESIPADVRKFFRGLMPS